MTEAGKRFPSVVAEAPQSTLLAFDFDGTLARIVPDPDTVSMVERSAAALERLAPVVGRIAIISGRPVRLLERAARVADRPALSRAVILGQYGAERLDVETGRRIDPPIPPGIAAARGEVMEILADMPGARLEDKGRAIAAHVRQCANPERALAGLATPMRLIAERHGLILEPGRLVWELRSATVTKGDALRDLVQQEKVRAVLMAGDDLGDLAAFDALADFADRGIATCALVSGSHELPQLADQADILCDGPDGVAAWLESLANAIVSD